MSDKSAAEVSPLIAGLTCRCPRCGKGALFGSVVTLSLRKACPSCGLDFAFIDTGDGPAVFAILILGVVVLGLALVLEFRYDPPLWLFALIVIPVTLAVALAVLRPLKATLIALQYHHKAGEGRPEA